MLLGAGENNRMLLRAAETGRCWERAGENYRMLLGAAEIDRSLSHAHVDLRFQCKSVSLEVLASEVSTQNLDFSTFTN